MVFASNFIGIDWGTTNRRTYVIADGRVEHSEQDNHGTTAMCRDQFKSEIASIRTRLGDLPVLMAGMVGSSIGWRNAPYVRCPAGINDLAAQLLWCDPRTAIIPGLSLLDDGRADVMRGEEVQLLGAIVSGLVPPDALMIQPGTHCKWVEAADGRIVRFTTAMTGELFALLRSHGLLAPQLQADVVMGSAFAAGVEEGRKRDLGASLFGIRASGLLGLRDDDGAASYASGMLIGSDVAARLAVLPSTVYILADSMLGSLYAHAVVANGGTACFIDSNTAFSAGLIALGQLT